MRVFKLLEARKKRRRLSKTEEYKFYAKNSHLLEKYSLFSSFSGVERSFELIRANIILRAIINKMTIETNLERISEEFLEKRKKLTENSIRKAMKEIIEDLPYIAENDQHILIPFFSRGLNVIYVSEYDKLLTYPYNELKKDFTTSVIDCFDTYNYALFDSFFTRLIHIGSGKTCRAFFGIDYLTIYVINDQGRLDMEIPLFDKYIKKVDEAQILNRAQIVMEYYFNNDLPGFIASLRKQKLISDFMYMKFKKKLLKKKKL